MARMPPGGDYGGGYLKVQRHLRTAVISMGFALVTTTPFTADLTVPSISQAQLTGYKYPARTVRQTEPQNGWLYTAATPFDPTVTVAPIEQSQLEWYRSPRRTVRQTDPQSVYELLGTYSPALDIDSHRPAKKLWRDTDIPQDGWLYTAAAPAFDPTVAVAPVGQSQLTGYRYPARAVRQADSQDGWFYETLPVVWDASKFQNNSGERTSAAPATRYRYADYPGTDWIYQNLPAGDVWDESKFQNISGEMTQVRAALKFRYPLASTGFSTDGSTPDVWDASKFQNISWDRTHERRVYDPRYEHHKFSFGLLDARVVMPAIDQLSTSERVAQRKGRPIVTPDSLGWLYENLPVAFDPQYLIHSDDSRMRERYKKFPRLDQPAQDWIFTAGPPFDARLLIQVSAPHRMAERAKLDLQAGQFYNDLAWARDVLNLPDPTEEVGPIIILGGGDDAPAKRKRQKTFQDLYQEIERTLHALVHQKPAVGVPLVPAGRLDQALAELSQLAQGQRVLVQQVVGLREEIARLEQARHQAILDDDADWEWFA